MAQPISLRVTETARVALLDFLSKCTPGSIAAVVWSEASGILDTKLDGTPRFRDTGPEWGVGAYNKEKIPESEVVTISGIPFVFAQGEISERLNGKTLHYRNGAFCVE